MARALIWRMGKYALLAFVVVGLSVALIGAFNSVAADRINSAANKLLSKQMTLDSTSASEWAIIKADLVNHHSHPEFWASMQRQCNQLYTASVAKSDCSQLIGAIKLLTARGDMSPLRFVDKSTFVAEASEGTGIHGSSAFVTVKGHFVNRAGKRSWSTPSATYHVRLDQTATQQWKLTRVRVTGYNPS